MVVETKKGENHMRNWNNDRNTIAPRGADADVRRYGASNDYVSHSTRPGEFVREDRRIDNRKEANYVYRYGKI